ncbi:MAG: MMPL family transporter [Acidimicrobiales bacterium]|nr:MMPL family transporter [Acidimicrobiales bacterium]
MDSDLARDADTQADGPHGLTMDPKNSVIARLGLFASANWKLTLAVWLATIAGGAWAFLGGLDREGFPPIDVPIAITSGVYFVDDVETVDSDVAEPLASIFAEAEGVESVVMNANPNGFFSIIQFESGFTSPQGVAVLEDAASDLQLPPQVQVDYQTLDAAKFVETYDILVSVSGPVGVDTETLQSEAESIRAFLAETPGVTLAETRELITEAQGVDGTLEERQTRFSRTFFEGNDGFTPAIQVGLVRDADDETLDILKFSDRINERLDDAPALAEGFRVDVTGDFAVDIRNQVNSLIGNLVTGLLAVTAVSFLLIGWRASLVTAAFMITVMTGALLVLFVVGYTLNTITLFGLILTLGLLVDDAIVIGESIDATKVEGGTKERILGVSLTRVALASLAGTLTTVLVFGPLAFIGGILGEFIRAIPVTVIITLIASYIASIVFIPTIGKYVLLAGGHPRNPIAALEKKLSVWTGRLASFPARRGAFGIVVGVLLALLPIMAIAGAGQIAAGLGFNIFPSSKDANILFIESEFPPGTTIEDAQAVAERIDEVTVDVLGEDLVRSQYVRGNVRRAENFLDLVPFGDRSDDRKAPFLREELQSALSAVPGARVTVSVIDAGPPVLGLPFAVQISTGDDPAAAQALADELVAILPGQILDKSGETTTVVTAIESTAGIISRNGPDRFIEVRASYDNDDLTANLNATQELIENDLVPAERLTELGLRADALEFDFGQESDNQEDFASLGTFGSLALLLMFILLVVQFRSVLQPVLVFLAIPFSFLGLTAALAATDNGISFFSGVGFIALIGVVVNNTILLVDSANQARRSGLSLGASIEQAVRRRFRPLVATALTTVAGLLPLALSDPFWEGLSFTLMGGLLSSTFLVLLSFPIYYLSLTSAVEWLAGGSRWMVVAGAFAVGATLAAVLSGGIAVLGTIIAGIAFFLLLELGLTALKRRFGRGDATPATA